MPASWSGSSGWQRVLVVGRELVTDFTNPWEMQREGMFVFAGRSGLFYFIKFFLFFIIIFIFIFFFLFFYFFFFFVVVVVAIYLLGGVEKERLRKGQGIKIKNYN
jgi:hypothetical protein